MKQTTVTAKEKGGNGKVKHMRIEPAANGFVVKTRHEMSPEKMKEAMYDMDGGEETHVCSSADELGKHVMSKFGGGKKKEAKSSGYVADKDEDGE